MLFNLSLERLENNNNKVEHNTDKEVFVKMKRVRTFFDIKNR